MRRILPAVALLAGGCLINPDGVLPPPPTGLTYSSNSASYLLEQPITENVPSISGGGPVDSYDIRPVLPTGLVLNATTGIISGNPTALSRATSYTVTATNRGGFTTATLTIAVVDGSPPPGGLTYLVNPAIYTKGQAIPLNVPSSDGGTVGSYDDPNPALPSGLTIDHLTGVISGTPAVITPQATYVVTATNPGGSTTASLVITVNDQKPQNLTYSLNPAVYLQRQAIPNNVPSSTGGAVVTYSIAPPLPTGLTLDPTTGIISGTPTAPSSATYMVTATNSGGSAITSLTISVTGGPDAVTGGFRHTCALVGGGVRCWGDNGFGQLGDYNDGGIDHVQVYSLTSGAQAIASGGYHTCALVGGGVRCWGDNQYGQLGDSTYNGAFRPVQVAGLTSGASVIAAGGRHSCAIINDGGALCWGDNTYGQLGDGLDAGSTVFVAVTGLTSKVQAIAVGGGHTCAIVNGGAFCWGDNTYGQIGDNTHAERLMPVQVMGLTSGVQAIATGCNHTCAIVNGGVQCWGDNGEGELGDSTFTPSPRPVQVVGLTSGAQALTAGCIHTCAIVDGSARCWGKDGTGQLGDNATVNSPVPVQAVGLASGTQSMGAGYYHTCATSDGGLLCWGWNSAGQLGDGSRNNSLKPIPISP